MENTIPITLTRETHPPGKFSRTKSLRVEGGERIIRLPVIQDQICGPFPKELSETSRYLPQFFEKVCFECVIRELSVNLLGIGQNQPRYKILLSTSRINDQA